MNHLIEGLQRLAAHLRLAELIAGGSSFAGELPADYQVLAYDGEEPLHA